MWSRWLTYVFLGALLILATSCNEGLEQIAYYVGSTSTCFSLPSQVEEIEEVRLDGQRIAASEWNYRAEHHALCFAMNYPLEAGDQILVKW